MSMRAKVEHRDSTICVQSPEGRIGNCLLPLAIPVSTFFSFAMLALIFCTACTKTEHLIQQIWLPGLVK